jgi:hypothetical protein
MSTSSTLPAPPIPNDPRDLARWEHTRIRRDLLYGDWERHLIERLRKQIGNVRRDAWGNPDLSANVFRASMMQLAVLYDRPPRVHHGTDIAPLEAEVQRAGLWQLMQRVQRDCLGMREMLVRVDVVGPEDRPELSYQPVFPDLVIARSSLDDPQRPIALSQAVLRKSNKGPIWTFDAFDIDDEDNPSFRVLDADHRKDLTEELFDAETRKQFAGDGYRWRRAGRPVMPYVLYHAAQTGCLWDAYEGRELVDGSLNVAVKWTMFGHVVRNASWPQRVVVGARVPGASVEGSSETSKRSAVVSDPALIMELEVDADYTGPVMVTQWANAADPAALQEAIALYERRVAAYAGISPSDIQRVAGDPRSGYALAITREAQREAQRRFEPVFRRGDEELIALSASLMNGAANTAWPEDGYRVAYEALPPSAEERQSEREHILALIEQDLLDKVSAYQQLHPGLTRADAEKQLDEIARVNTRFRAA